MLFVRFFGNVEKLAVVGNVTKSDGQLAQLTLIYFKISSNGLTASKEDADASSIPASGQNVFTMSVLRTVCDQSISPVYVPFRHKVLGYQNNGGGGEKMGIGVWAGRREEIAVWGIITPQWFKVHLMQFTFM